MTGSKALLPRDPSPPPMTNWPTHSAMRERRIPNASRVVSSKGMTGEKYAEPNGTASIRLRAHIRKAAGMDLRKVCRTIAAGAVGVPSLGVLGDGRLASSSLSSATIDPTTAEKDTLLLALAALFPCFVPPRPLLLRRMGVSSSNGIMLVACCECSLCSLRCRL